ncbi:MAG: hypothetical protein JWN72_2815 [Thermoleophilia bacterium]|nr:hypothetical protein [Thermoleophilia bacterium]
MADDLRMEEMTHSVRELLLSYERLDGTWRHSLALNANEKLTVAFLAGRGAATAEQLAEWTALDDDEIHEVIAGLKPRQYVVGSEATGLDLLQLAKKGVMARLSFEAVFDDLVAAAAEPGGAETEAILRFLAQAINIFDAHAHLHARA